MQKQISIFLPLEEWKALREEAAKKRTPITERCRNLIYSGLRAEGRDSFCSLPSTLEQR